MADKAGGYRGGVEAALADFIELLGKAILSGIATSVVLALITLGLATSAGAQATPNDAKSGALLFHNPGADFVEGPCDYSALRGTEPRSVALTPPPNGEHTGVGALWARAPVEDLMEEHRRGAAMPGTLPQADTASTLQILLGLLALAAAAMVALIGRCITAGEAARPEGAR